MRRNFKKYINKFISLAMCILIALITVYPNIAIAATVSQQVKSGIESFPESYRPALYKLKEVHPNWNFEAYYTGLDWSEVEAHENICLKNTVYENGVPNSLWLCTCGKYGDTGYRCASKKAVNYYLDPRNFLTETTVFQFLELSYDSNITRANVEAAVKNSFLSGSVNIDGANYTYVDLIMQASQETQVSAMHIVVTIFQEIGRGTRQADGSYSLPKGVTGTVPGYEGLYNFFNYGASDGSGAVERGLEKARSLGWTNPKIALINGTKVALADNYINKGQNTKYFYKFDVVGNSILKAGESCSVDTSLFYNHQYMTNIKDPNSQSSMLFNRYADSNLLDTKLTFRIPVYNNMPTYIKAPTNLTENDGTLYYVSSNYDSVNIRSSAGGAVIGSLPKDTVIVLLVANENGSKWHKIKLENGTVCYMAQEYLSPCNLKSDVPPTVQTPEIKTEGSTMKTTPTVKVSDIKAIYQSAVIKNASGTQITDSNVLVGTGYTVAMNGITYTVVKMGDVNGDGNIKATDYMRIKNCIMGATELTNAQRQAADVNGDGQVKATDYMKIKNYIMGVSNIGI